MLTSGAYRVALTGLTAALATCSTPPQSNTTPAAPSAEAEATPEADAPRTFDPNVVRVDPESTEGRILLALDAGDADTAGQLAASALAHGRDEDPHRLAWLSARASIAAGRPAVGFGTLASVAESDHPLARWAACGARGS